jgi:hypothetical protein
MTCIGKDVFVSQRIAAEIGRRSQHRSYRAGKTVHRIHTYYCGECCGWHVTGHNGLNNLDKGKH